MQDEIKNISDKNIQYIPLSEAGQILNTSRDYMNVLVRRGKLRAIKLGRNWVTTSEWLNEYKNPSDLNIGVKDLEKEEKEEFRNLKSGLILEREKSLEAGALIPEIKLSSRELQREERKNILELVQSRFKKIDALEFEKASRRWGILKSLRQGSSLKLAAVSLAIVLLITTIGFAGLNILKFKNLNISLFRQGYEGQAKFQASILSDVFKNFPSDIPLFYRWFTLSLSKGFAFLKSKTPSELATGELLGGKSKIIRPQEAPPRIDTFDEALALDAGLVEELPQLADGSTPLTTGGEFTLIENRLSIVEANLKEQKALTGAELSLQKKTILGTLETLIGISKLLPTHPISTIVVQGQPATLTTYSVQPSVHSGFDRLSASYLTLSNNAEINGSLTVKSGGTFNSLSVSGATTLTGNTTIGGALSVAGDSTFGNVTVNGTLNIPGKTSLGNASTTYLTVSNTAWINQLKVTGTATTTFNGPITSASGNFIIAGDSASNVLLNPYGGKTVMVNASSTVLTADTFFSTAGTITNASTTYLTIANDLWGNRSAFSTSIKTPLIWNSGPLTASTTGANPIIFAANSSERMRIDESGKIFIATTTIPSGFGANIATSTFVYGNQFIYGGLGVGIATTTTGAIQTSGDVFVGRNLRVAGNSTTIGGSSSDTLVVNSSVGSNLVPTSNNFYNLGSPSFYWGNLYIDTVNANNISGASTTISGTKSNDFTINTDNTSVDQENMNLIFYRGTVPPNAVISWNAATSSKYFKFNQSTRFFNESASTTNPTLTVQGVTNQTANVFQALDVATSTVLFSVNPVSQKTTMINASTTNLTVSGNLWAGSSGAFMLADGTVSNPALAFAADTDTGLFRLGDGKMSFATNATTSLTLDTGKVIVGNDLFTATYQLEVADRDANNNTIVDELRLSHFTTGTAGNGLGAGLLFYGQDSTGAGQNLARVAAQVEEANPANGFLGRLIFSTVGSGGLLEKMRLTGNGQLLLGTTTTPFSYGANIATSTNIFGKLTVGTSSLDLLSGNIISNSGQFNITNAANTALTFSTNNSERMRIDNSGNVGIRTTIPSAILHTSKSGTGDQEAARFSAPSGNPYITVGNGVTATTGGFINWDDTNDVLGFGIHTASIPAININNGNVGIGTTNPGTKLEVNGGEVGIVGSGGSAPLSFTDGGAKGVKFQPSLVGTNGGKLTIQTKPDGGDLTDRLTISDSGNVGVGTTSPNLGAAGTTPVITFDGSIASILELSGSRTTDSFVGYVGFWNKASASASKYSGVIYGYRDGADNSGALVFSTNNAGTLSEKVRIDKSGNVGIGTTTPGSKLEVSGSPTGFVKTTIRNTAAGTGNGAQLSVGADDDADRLYIQSFASTYTTSGMNVQSGSVINGEGPGGLSIAATQAPIRFYTNGSVDANERMRITTGGNVGIGTTNPLATLHVSGGTIPAAFGTGATALPTTHANHRFIFLGTNAIGSINSAAAEIQVSSNSYIDTAGVRKYTTTNPATLYEQTGGEHVWYYKASGTANTAVNFTEAMRIGTSGNVGIGTTSPSQLLEVAGGGAVTAIVINQTSSTANRAAALDLKAIAQNANADWRIQTGTTAASASALVFTQGTAKVVFESGGNVGIGTASPSSSLHVVKAGDPNPIFVNTNTADGSGVTIDFFTWAAANDPRARARISSTKVAGGDHGDLKFTVRNAGVFTEALYIKQDGNVGIGTVSPASWQSSSIGVLDVIGGGGVGAMARFWRGGSEKKLYLTAADNTWAGVGVEGKLRLAGGVTSDNPYTVLNGANGITVDSVGNVGIGTTTPTTGLTMGPSGSSANIAVPNGWICVDNDGGCAGATAGTIYVRNADIVGGSDVAENYYSTDALEAGEIVQMKISKSDFGASLKSDFDIFRIEKATSTSQTIIGVVSTAPAMTIGSNSASSYPVALAGRVPVKVSLENGPIVVGDRISASSVAGIGKKAEGGEATVGMALEAFDGTGIIPGVGKIMVFVNLGQPQLAAAKGTGDLAEMTVNTTSLNGDLNLNGFSILNVKSIVGMNGLWKIDENGNITAQSVQTQSLTVGGGASGVTVYDRTTTAPKCIYIEGGVIKTSDGACGQTTNTGSEAVVQPASAPVPSATIQATTTPAVGLPSATTTIAIETATSTEPVVATTTEAVIASTTTPEAATTTP